MRDHADATRRSLIKHGRVFEAVKALNGRTEELMRKYETLDCKLERAEYVGD